MSAILAVRLAGNNLAIISTSVKWKGFTPFSHLLYTRRASTKRDLQISQHRPI